MPIGSLTTRKNMFSAMTLWLAVAGCQNAQPAAVGTPSPTTIASSAPTTTATPSPAPGGSVAPSPTPVTSAPAAYTLNGKAVLPSGAFANATVNVYAIGSLTVLGTGKTGADGSYSITLPGTAANQLLQIVANSGTQTLTATTSVGTPSASNRKILDVDTAPQLDLGSTLAFLALQARLSALGQVSPTPEQVAAAVAAVAHLSGPALIAAAGLSPADQQAILQSLNSQGQGTVPPSLAARVTAASSTLTTDIENQALALGALITTQIAAGHAPNAPVGALTFGGASAPAPASNPTPSASTGTNTSSGGSNGGGAYDGSPNSISTNTTPIATTVNVVHALAMDVDTRNGSAWAVEGTDLVHLSNSQTTLSMVSIIHGDGGLASFVSVDQTDGSVWVVEGTSVTHISSTGALSTQDSSQNASFQLNNSEGSVAALVASPVDSSAWLTYSYTDSEGHHDSTIAHLNANNTEADWQTRLNNPSFNWGALAVSSNDGSVWATTDSVAFQITHLPSTGTPALSTGNESAPTATEIEVGPGPNGVVWSGGSEATLFATTNTNGPFPTFGGQQLESLDLGADRFAVSPTDGSVWVVQHNSHQVTLLQASTHMTTGIALSTVPSIVNDITLNPTDGSAWVVTVNGLLENISTAGATLQTIDASAQISGGVGYHVLSGLGVQGIKYGHNDVWLLVPELS